MERGESSVAVRAVEREEGLVMAGADHNPRVYPSPLFLSHAEISTNSSSFSDALRHFHSAMGTRLMVPVIGGKELDLHQLYVEVTKRGGLEKVIKDRLWREVIASFNFPPTTTSASFVLRKYYLNLLYHFEQLYLFRVQGPLLPPSAILQTRNSVSRLDLALRQPSVCESSLRNNALCLRPAGVPVPPQTANGYGFKASDNAQRFPAVDESIAATVAQSVPANGDDNGIGASDFVPVAPNSGKSISTAILQTRTPLSKRDPGLRQPSVCESSKKRNIALCLRPAGVPVPPQTANGYGFKASDNAQRVPAVDASIAATVSQSVPANGNGIGVGASDFVPVAPNSGEIISTGTRNFHVSGTIDGKFEHGYFVTVKIGSQTLHGVLYHAYPLHQAKHPPPEAPSSSTPVPMTAIVPYIPPVPVSTAIVPYIPPTRSIQRRRRRKYRDPSHPKPNRSAYNFFFAEKHSKLKTLYPQQERQYSRMIGQSWSKLTEEERQVYNEYGRRDKERYRRELHEYKERMRHAPARATAKPRDVVMEDVRENENAKDVVKVTEVEMGESSSTKNNNNEDN